MNKLTLISLPLSITSAILRYNLGWISPVAAQEYSLFDDIINIETITILDLILPWQSLDETFSDYYSTQLKELGLDNVNLKFKTIQSSNIATSLEEIPESLSISQPSISLAEKSTISLASITNATSKASINALETNESTQSKPTVDNSYSNIAKSESFLVIDNLNASYDHNAGLVSSDNSIKQTLAQIEQYDLQNQQDLTLEPLTRVSDLRDINPSDWAYEALLKLINRYRCFAGYEDNTFKGDRNISRYEFAAALNTCLKKIEAIAIEKIPEYFTEESLAQLEKLTKEFEQELIAVQTKTDNLESRVAFLEDTNFSPTTILRGEVVMQMASAFGDKKAVPSGSTPTEDLDSVVTFGARTRLNFDTSFTGRDLLRTRIEASNLSGYGLDVTGTQMTFLGVASNTGNNVRLGQIFYRFPLGDKGNAYIAGARQSASTFIPLLNRATTISLFGLNNPLYDLGFGAGGGFYYQFTDLIGAGATYYAGSPNNPEPSRGFFNGDYSALGQITLTPSDNFGISLTYAHFFTPEPRLTTNLTGFTGSIFAQLPFGVNTATSSDNFNISLSYQVSDRLELGGWLGYINAEAKSSPADSGLDGSQGDNADIWTAALTATYNDLGKLGSKLSFILGLPPKLTNNDVSDREDEDTSLHLELSYNYPLTERISLTPGVLAITSPEHNDKNSTIVIALLRTTLRF